MKSYKRWIILGLLVVAIIPAGSAMFAETREETVQGLLAQISALQSQLTTLLETEGGTVLGCATGDAFDPMTGQACATIINPAPAYHNADLDKDYKISQAELDNVSILFNSTTGYTCTSNPIYIANGWTWVVGSNASAGCGFFGGDLNKNYKVDLPELLRIVTYKNAGGYKVQVGTEDGFAPITSTNIAGCAPGAAFNSLTGQPCVIGTTTTTIATPTHHDGDLNHDYKISQAELDSVTTLFNSTTGYACTSNPIYVASGWTWVVGTVLRDGSCRMFGGDLNKNWKIDLTELLRITQYKNAGGYKVSNGTVDGFTPITDVSTGVTVTATPISATLSTVYNSFRPSTPLLKATHNFKVTSTKNISIWAMPEMIYQSGDYAGISQESRIISATGATVVNNDYVKVTAGQEAIITVVSTFDSNKLFKGSYYSRLGNPMYIIGHDIQKPDLVNGRVNFEQKSNLLAVVGETGPYISSIANTSSNGVVRISGVRFNEKVTVKVGDKVFEAVSVPVQTFVADPNPPRTISFNQITQNIPSGRQSVVVSDSKGDSNTFWFDFTTWTTTTTTAAPSIKVLSPNGGEIYSAGSKVPIKWSATNGSPFVTVMLVNKNNGLESYITKGIFSDVGGYDWTIPTNLVPTGTTGAYKIQVQFIKDGVLVAGYDLSDSTFNITNGPIVENTVQITPTLISSNFTVDAPVMSGMNVISQGKANFTYAYKLRATADTYIDKGCFYGTGTSSGIYYNITDVGNNVQGTNNMRFCMVESTSFDAQDSSSQFKLRAGQDREFRAKIVVGALANGSIRANISKAGNTSLSPSWSSPVAWLSYVGTTATPTTQTTTVVPVTTTVTPTTQTTTVTPVVAVPQTVSNVKVDLSNNTWTHGETKNVTWSSAGLGDSTVDLILCNSTQCWPSVMNTPNDGNQAVKLYLTDKPEGRDYYIKVRKYNNNNITAKSANFIAMKAVTTTQTSSILLSIQNIFSSLGELLLGK